MAPHPTTPPHMRMGTPLAWCPTTSMRPCPGTPLCHPHVQHVICSSRQDPVNLQAEFFLPSHRQTPAAALPLPQARARCGQLLACCGHPDVAAGWVRPLERLAGVNAVAAGVLAAKLAAGEKVGGGGGVGWGLEGEAR